MKSFILRAAACASAVILLSGCGNSERNAKVDAMRTRLEENKYIIHACGEIADESGQTYTYTNSKEALENSYNAGNRVIEMDFHYTSDDHLVPGYAWGDLYLGDEQMTPGVPPSLSDYLQCKIDGAFTPMTFEDVAEFMRAHEDLFIVTDTKEENEKFCKLISHDYPDLEDRFIVQIYHAKEYEPVIRSGFDYVIFTLYETEEAERTPEALLGIAKKHLVGFTVYAEWADDPQFLESLKKTDTPIYVHTVNEDAEMAAYFDLGIKGIYTDRTDLSSNISR
ncbi:glycerophosphodiester phosphodiesterase family protein [Butyrivibrio sp. WCD3002]|uniref:glycerophosphodiester phosphodiesterase family protein n=1 Tax=Butyrivibrio sp. WCD3002 TaxID=1280676 RepID=UPI00041FBF8F|nr:glycerophosphodiester phosphodiesterase family protein [Butyrivibrio sp. WCD3002]